MTSLAIPVFWNVFLEFKILIDRNAS